MPMKVEIFHKNKAEELQKPINEWLEGKPDATIKHITQSQVQHGQHMDMPITVCIWYTESQQYK